MFFLGYYLDRLKGRCETYARFAIGRHSPIDSRHFVCRFLHGKGSSPPKRKGMDPDTGVKLPEFCAEQWAQHMGCTIYKRGIGFYHGRHLSALARSDRIIFCQGKDPPQCDHWFIAWLCRSMYYFL